MGNRGFLNCKTSYNNYLFFIFYSLYIRNTIEFENIIKYVDL